MKKTPVPGPATQLIDICYEMKAQMCDAFDALFGLKGTALSSRKALDECFAFRRPYFVETDRLFGSPAAPSK